MLLSGVDTNLIIALRALLLCRNVTRAAKEVGLTQSSMSHALSRLRSHFHDPLLVPVGRALVLSDLGKSLVEPALDAASKLERVFIHQPRFDPSTSTRVFRIAATDNLELYMLPPLAATLQKHAPRIEVRVSALPPDWGSALRRGDIDLKLGRAFPPVEGLESENLSSERFACVVRRGHPAPARLSVGRYAALDHLVVTPTPVRASDPSSVVDELLGERGLRRRVAMSVPHFLVAPFVVAHSDLVLTAPERLLDPFVKLLDLRRLRLPLHVPPYTLSQVWATRTGDDEASRWLRVQVARTLAKPTRTAHGP